MKRHIYTSAIALFILWLAATGNAFATTYYLATNGSDSYSKAQAQNITTPWKTFRHADSQLSPGDTVIVRGGTYSTGGTIDVPNTTWKNYPDETPLIDGQLVRPGTVGGGTLVWIKASGVVWDGINIAGSTNYNLLINSYNKPIISDVVVENSKFYESYRQTVFIAKTHNFTMKNCEAYHGIISAKDGSNDSGAMVDIKESDGFLFTYNKFHESYRDGFIVDEGSNNGTVEYNQIYGNSSCQLYLCNAKDDTVRYNLIYGWFNPDNLILGYRSHAGVGISISSEPQWGTTPSGGHRIYGNLIAGCGTNIRITMSPNALVPPTDCDIYNNTLVEAEPSTTTGGLGVGFVVSSRAGSGHVFENNIIRQTEGVISSVATRKVTCDYNLWSRAPDTNAQGPHDPIYALPMLAKTSGWDQLRAGALDGSEFALQKDSPAIGRGLLLSGDYNELPDCASSNWPAGAIKMMQNGTSSKKPDIGASVCSGPTTGSFTPSTPTQLTVVATN